MDENDFRYLEQNWKLIPLPALAEKFSLSLTDLTSLLRKRGIATEIQPFELEYIDENLDKMPASEIQEKLSLSSTQLSQIVGRLGRTRRISSAEMTLPIAIARTRWLVEEELHLPVDDFLPRTITHWHFTQNDLYGCIHFAENTKKRDSLYRSFPSVAFLVCQAYPHRFRPFQFRHAKTNDYFKGPNGRKNLINAARWVIEKKMGHKPEMLPLISRNKYFLRSSDLQFYGVGSRWLMNHFPSHEDFVAAILKEYKVSPADTKGTTTNLRQLLTAAGRPPLKCEMPECYYDDEYQLDIHHIIPKSARNQSSVDIHDCRNLIALCPNHHRIASRFDWKQLDLSRPDTWSDSVVGFVCNRNIESANSP